MSEEVARGWEPDPDFPNVQIYSIGAAVVTLETRPPYCDRGHLMGKSFGYVGNVEDVPDIDAADAFPRYFMDEERAKAELADWLHWRTGVPKPVNRAAEEIKERVLAVTEARGEFIALEDGFLYYVSRDNAGAIASHELRILADELDKRNAPWAERMAHDLEVASRIEDSAEITLDSPTTPGELPPSSGPEEE